MARASRRREEETSHVSTSRKPAPQKIKIDLLETIKPLTKNQELFFESYRANTEMLVLHGVAGTGKSFIAVYKALEEVLNRATHYDKVIIIRSAVQTREIGHLPGDLAEKLEQYQLPYKQICQALFGRRDAYAMLVDQGSVEFASTSFVRGLTFDDAVIIVDECQNMTWEELDTIITRVGDRSRIIFCGDYRQTDLKKTGDKSGLFKFLDVLKLMKSYDRIEFGVEDIVRSSLVKEYILARTEYEDKEK